MGGDRQQAKIKLPDPRQLAAARNTRTAADGNFAVSFRVCVRRFGTIIHPALSKTACRRHARCYFANAVQHAKHICNQSCKPALSGLLVALVLLLNALAASPALHELIHKDAGQADHECAITLFAHGQVDSASCDVPVVVPLALIETTPSIIFSVPSTAIENLPPGRAPPVFPAVS